MSRLCRNSARKPNNIGLKRFVALVVLVILGLIVGVEIRRNTVAARRTHEDLDSLADVLQQILPELLYADDEDPEQNSDIREAYIESFQPGAWERF